MRNYLLALGAATALSVGAAVIAQPSQAQSVEAPAAADLSQQATPAVRSGAYQLDKSHAKIIWAVNHFGFSTYYGEFTDFDARLVLDAAAPERSRLTVTVATPSVAAHDGALETHLRSADFFDVANHQTATFVSTAVERTGATTADVTGDFTLRGITRPLTLAVTFNGAGDNMGGVYTAGFSATGTIKRSDYGITYGVPAVGDEVALLISGEFNPAR